MDRTPGSLALMIAAPPLTLLLWVHTVRVNAPASDVPALVVAGLIGLAGVAIAPWSARTRVYAGAAYVAAAAAILPFVGLLAICSTGDCL